MQASQNPFHLTAGQVATLCRVLLLLVPVWLILVASFKLEPNPATDEPGYHHGAQLLSRSLERGTFLSDLNNEPGFKYPGYYALAATAYFSFGEHPIVVRALGLLAAIALAVVVSNTAAIVAGPRAKSFAMVLALMSPVYLFFSMGMYRDIFIALGAALILHALLAATSSRAGVWALARWPALLGYAIVFVMRTPQLVITLSAVAIAYLVSYVLSLQGRRRAAVALVFGTAIYLLITNYVDLLLDLVAQTVFLSGFVDGSLELSHLQALSDTSFSSPAEILSAFTSPKFVATSAVLKVSEFLLGLHPFAQSTGQASLIDSMFGQYRTEAWGGYQWEDTLLVHGLQWVVHFALLPLVVTGIVGVFRWRVQASIALTATFCTFALITLFTGNVVRWGLPNMAIYCILAGAGFAWRDHRTIGLYLLCGNLLLAVTLLRAAGLAVPMIVVPAALMLIVALRTAANPFRHESDQAAPAQTAERDGALVPPGQST